MNVRPSDRVLEIGCGHGVAATFVCERLGDGHLTAIDRSGKMIELASRRNKEFVASGKAEFLLGAFENLDLGTRRFDKIFAIRVGMVYRESERARRILEKWLAARGRIFSDYDPP
jgi:ubiquinone/menaquinone biosynthesis C-methylase UbiE